MKTKWENTSVGGTNFWFRMPNATLSRVPFPIPFKATLSVGELREFVLGCREMTVTKCSSDKKDKMTRRL
jgi:hypothetical protein